MSPIDDELRAALHGRARAVSPSPDPLLGVERRARRLRRNRVAASVAGSALAVAAVATAVPLLQMTPTSQPAPRATTETTPSPAPVTDRYALDPADPWAYRGDRSLLEDGFPETIAREVAARQRVEETEVELTPLFGQVYEPSAQAELVWLAEVDGQLSWGVAQESEAGPELLWDQAIEGEVLALAAALPGDEVARLLVVASPETAAAQYGPDDASEFSDAARLADGVHTAALEGDPATDSYRVLDEAGDEVVRAPAPDSTTASPPEGEGTAEPANLLDWPSRGSAPDAELESRLLAAFEQALTGLDGERPHSGVVYQPLFTTDTDGGVRFTIGQAYAVGREAHTVSLTLGGEQGEQFLFGPLTDPDALVVAGVICCEPGTTTDTLVVVPVPGTGQVLYDDDAEGEFRPAPDSQDFLDGVVLLDRDPRAQADRLQLLDGDGDLDRPLFEGPVASLLCGVKECG